MKKLFAVVLAVCVFYDVKTYSYAAENDIVIKGGTEVLVKTTERLKSNQVHTGQTIRFTVERAVVDDNGVTLIEGGAPAWGTVTKVAKAGLFGAGGKLGITIDSVEAYNGKVIQLSENKNNDGENVAGVAIIAAVVVTPWTLLFRGSNAVIEAGTIFSAYVANTTVIEEAEEYVEPEPNQKQQKSLPRRRKRLPEREDKFKN